VHPDDNFTWSTHQLTGFLAAVSSAEVVASTRRRCSARLRSALDT